MLKGGGGAGARLGACGRQYFPAQPPQLILHSREVHALALQVWSQLLLGRHRLRPGQANSDMSTLVRPFSLSRHVNSKFQKHAPGDHPGRSVPASVSAA